MALIIFAHCAFDIITVIKSLFKCSWPIISFIEYAHRYKYTMNTYTHTRLTALCPGLPR